MSNRWTARLAAVALCCATVCATSRAAAKDRPQPYARLGLGLAIGQDFATAKARPLPGLAGIVAIGIFMLPDLALEVMFHGMGGMDVFGSQPITFGGGDDDRDTSGRLQGGLYATGRGYLPEQPDTFGLVGVGLAMAGSPSNPYRTGGGAIFGLGWESDKDRTGTYGVLGTYSLGVVDNPGGFLHALTVVGYGTFEL